VYFPEELTPGAFLNEEELAHDQEGVQEAVPAASRPVAARHPVQLLRNRADLDQPVGLSGPAGFSLVMGRSDDRTGEPSPAP
jgi:hypothetical protein